MLEARLADEAEEQVPKGWCAARGQQVRSVPTRSEERFEVTAYDPARHLEIQGQLGPFPARLSYALDALPEGTRVTNSVELELHGPGRLLGRVAVPRVREAVAANLGKLKELLEG